MRAAILPHLTPDQRARYETFEAEREARHERIRRNVRDYLQTSPKSEPPSSNQPTSP
ncbi:MAG: hypothetical protein Fur0032_00800 [Terrimicrobiaceae bacterium]